jgi:outer membrane protein assembly factor BamB
MRIVQVLTVTLIVLFCGNPSLAATDYHAYRLLNDFEIGGTGTHYIASDETQIYVPHDHTLVVLNADTGKTVGDIPVPEGHIKSVAIASEFNKGFVYAEPNSITVFDTRSLNTIKKLQITEGDEDEDLGFLVYDPASKRVFPILKDSTVLDARTGEKVGEVTLGTNLGTAVADGKGTVYFTLQGQGAVVALDANSLKISKTYPVDGCLRPQSLSFDASNHRLFVGCYENGRLAVLDAGTGKLVANELICSAAATSAFDRDEGLIFESCGEGVISVIRQLAPDDYDVMDTIKTARYAVDMTFIPDKKRIYVNAVDAGKHQPGNLRVLVFGR